MKTKKLTKKQKRAVEECMMGTSYEKTARAMSTPTDEWTTLRVVYLIADILRAVTKGGDIRIADLLDKHY